MAELGLVCESLRVCFVILLSLNSAFSSQDYYSYTLNSNSATSQIQPDLVLNESPHSIQKRSAQENRLSRPMLKDDNTQPQPVQLANVWPQQRLLSTTKMPEINHRDTTTVKVSNLSPSILSAPLDSGHSEESTDEDISITKFSDSGVNFNDSLKDHNITSTKTDSLLYYNSTLKSDEKVGTHYWVDFSENKNATINELLSKSHRRAATVKLSFDFPFYGHIIRNVTIATGGFLYTGDYVHLWLAATQYIAPLMANFDTSLSNDSFVKYFDNGTAFTVLWENVALQDKPNDGKFTFEATLHSSGDIVFVYKSIPIIVENIKDHQHPVKVGLSDAYIIDRTIFFVRRKTIYEYHRVNFAKEDIKNGTVIYLSALPTCPGLTDCNSCLMKEMPHFQCTWCPRLNRCSNGLDRSRQDWLIKNCDKVQIRNVSECSQALSPEQYDDHDIYNHDNHIDHMEADPARASSRISHQSNIIDEPVKLGISGMIAILFILGVMVGLGFWIMYAYRNPHTTSGQILIRYRPSQWSWRRGEARYTAATIHM